MSKTTLQIEAEIIQLIKEDRLIEAVKFAKENTDLGLRESKEYVDSLREKL